MILPNNFSYGYYQYMLECALAANRQFLFFTEFDPTLHSHVVLLRHDIDISLQSAVKMARFEHSMGVKATYFIRLNSTFYNPFSQHEFPLLQEIINLGHDIGLHFDPSFYQNAGLDLLEGVRREKNALGSMLGQEVNAISQHRPFSLGIKNLENEPLFRFCVSNSLFTKTCKYISESCQRWREGDLVDHLPKYERIQLLVHPVWWHETCTPWQECFEQVCNQVCDHTSNKTDLLLKRYSDYLKIS